jgi:hypothetical protein
VFYVQIQNEKKNKKAKVAFKLPTKAKRLQALTEYLLTDLLLAMGKFWRLFVSCLESLE